MTDNSLLTKIKALETRHRKAMVVHVQTPFNDLPVIQDGIQCVKDDTIRENPQTIGDHYINFIDSLMESHKSHPQLDDSEFPRVVILANGFDQNPFKSPDGNVVIVGSESLYNFQLNNGKKPKCTTIVKIPSIKGNVEDLNDSYFKSRWDSVQKSLPQTSFSPTRLEFAGGNGTDVSMPKDSGHWTVEIGSDGIAGVYKTARQGTRDLWDYHLVASVGPGAAGNQLNGKLAAKITEHCDLKVSTVANSTDMSYLEDLAVRNSKRILYKIADSLELLDRFTGSAGNKIKFDEKSCYRDSNTFSTPKMLVPDHVQISNVFRVPKEQNVVLKYNGATPLLEDGKKGYTRDSVVVWTNPAEGFVKLPLDISSDRCKNSKTMPFGSGKLKEYPMSPPKDWKKEDLEKVTLGAIYTWDHPSEKCWHPKICSPGIYRSLSPEFYQSCHDNGWARDKITETYFPVACKVGNPL